MESLSHFDGKPKNPLEPLNMETPMIIQKMICRRPFHMAYQGKLGLKGLVLVWGVATLGLASAVPAAAADAHRNGTAIKTTEKESTPMWMSVGERRFSMVLDDSEAAQAFAEMLPLSLDKADLNSNEKYADLPAPLPRSASSPGTIDKGDVMLYGSKTLVVFYETFQTSYSYTRIGLLENADQLADVVGRRTIRIELSGVMPQSL